MWLADLLRRFVLFYLKFIFAMSALVLFLGYLQRRGTQSIFRYPTLLPCRCFSLR